MASNENPLTPPKDSGLNNRSHSDPATTSCRIWPTYTHRYLPRLGAISFSCARRFHLLKLSVVLLQADYETPYKQLLLGPQYACLAAVAPRTPADYDWEYSLHRAPLFGPAADAIYYNFCARPLAVIMNRSLGIQILNYIAYNGALVPETLGASAPSTLRNFSAAIGASMKLAKSQDGSDATRRVGYDPHPDRGRAIRASSESPYTLRSGCSSCTPRFVSTDHTCTGNVDWRRPSVYSASSDMRDASWRVPPDIQRCLPSPRLADR